jgi:hypothetical protein
MEWPIGCMKKRRVSPITNVEQCLSGVDIRSELIWPLLGLYDRGSQCLLSGARRA